MEFKFINFIGNNYLNQDTFSSSPNISNLLNINLCHVDLKIVAIWLADGKSFFLFTFNIFGLCIFPFFNLIIIVNMAQGTARIPNSQNQHL